MNRSRRISGLRDIRLFAILCLVNLGCGAAEDVNREENESEVVSDCELENIKYIAAPMWVMANDLKCGTIAELKTIEKTCSLEIDKSTVPAGCLFYVSWYDGFAESGRYPEHRIVSAQMVYFLDMDHITAELLETRPGLQNRDVAEPEAVEIDGKRIHADWHNLYPPEGELDYCNPPTAIARTFYVTGEELGEPVWLELPLTSAAEY